MKILDITDLSTWPLNILSHLEKNHSLYLGRQESGINPSSASAYNGALNEFTELVRNSGCSMQGYHCTRLTEAEIQNILDSGMSLPDITMLHKRIANAVAAGMLEESVAQCLMNKNLANDLNRAGMIWFCFFPPRNAGERGIGRFFRSWGGEALYNLHGKDKITGSALKKIGVPCIIEALVPIESFPRSSGLEQKLILRFLVNRGFETEESWVHEDRAKAPIPPENIIRIIRFPEADFNSLTGCNEWKSPLQLSL